MIGSNPKKKSPHIVNDYKNKKITVQSGSAVDISVRKLTGWNLENDSVSEKLIMTNITSLHKDDPLLADDTATSKPIKKSSSFHNPSANAGRTSKPHNCKKTSSPRVPLPDSSATGKPYKKSSSFHVGQTASKGKKSMSFHPESEANSSPNGAERTLRVPLSDSAVTGKPCKRSSIHIGPTASNCKGKKSMSFHSEQEANAYPNPNAAERRKRTEENIVNKNKIDGLTIRLLDFRNKKNKEAGFIRPKTIVAKINNQRQDCEKETTQGGLLKPSLHDPVNDSAKESHTGTLAPPSSPVNSVATISVCENLNGNDCGPKSIKFKRRPPPPPPPPPPRRKSSCSTSHSLASIDDSLNIFPPKKPRSSNDSNKDESSKGKSFHQHSATTKKHLKSTTNKKSSSGRNTNDGSGHRHVKSDASLSLSLPNFTESGTFNNPNSKRLHLKSTISKKNSSSNSTKSGNEDRNAKTDDDQTISAQSGFSLSVQSFAESESSLKKRKPNLKLKGTIKKEDMSSSTHSMHKNHNSCKDSANSSLVSSSGNSSSYTPRPVRITQFDDTHDSRTKSPYSSRSSKTINSLPPHVDRKGRCLHHQEVQLFKKKRFGG
eukprot:CAMPEP_0183743236 /NCGR_PEP_ID=MMETSP0737-20130205/65113_1 /TAXON_ID=385413 /ORGANISM="Thalassiosira miniscula, Strain CCMP1093" /LENGTH=601 /DNA_ID=CAMNT_0025978845 /DNA_START=149 /DNA_END=1951 /DNA_ORIENTATION=-